MTTLKTLTLVDDDDIFVFLTTKIIEQTNLVDLIKVFGNGLDAINFLKENKNNVDALPGIILLDLSMPIMNGWEFIEAYQMINIQQSVDMYILSSSVYENDIEKTKSYPLVKGFISKPLSIDRLKELVNAIGH